VKFKLVELEDFGPYGTYDVPAVLDGNGDAWAYNVGLLYRTRKFGFGVNYRSGFSIKYKGDLSLDTSGLPGPLKPFVPTSAGGTTNFSFPFVLGFGVSYNATEKLLLTVDFHYVQWSQFDRYTVEFDNPALQPLVVDEFFDDSTILRGGIQYLVSPQFALRAGVLYDWTPQPVETMDPLLPDANRLALTVGFGYKLGKSFVLDFAYQHEMFEDRTAPNRNIYKVGPVNFGEGNYSTTAHLLGVSLSFVF
jgi:long-chain fatty acid transport protein